MELFEELSKADPSWPAPDLKKNPPKESDPKFSADEKFSSRPVK